MSYSYTGETVIRRQEKDGHDAMNATMKNGANSDS